MIYAFEEVTGDSHSSELEQERFSTNCIKCLPIINETGKDAPFLQPNVLFNNGTERKDVVTALSTDTESQLVRKVRTCNLSKRKEPLKEHTGEQSSEATADGNCSVVVRVLTISLLEQRSRD